MSRVSASVREQVRKRAAGRCEYCRKPETAGGFNYQVDHIIPEKHLGSSEIDNLAWACFKCNNAKATDIASFDVDTGSLSLLYNPRSETWDEHFEIVDGIIVGKTPMGRVTVRVLEMNSPQQLEDRRLLIAHGLWD